MKRPPKGVYLVAVPFFVAGLFTVAQLLPYVFVPFGWDLDQPLLMQAGVERVLAGGVVGAIIVLCGVYSLIRLHAVPQWIFFAMTLSLVVQLALEPAGGSPFHTPGQIIVNRVILLLARCQTCQTCQTPSGS